MTDREQREKVIEVLQDILERMRGCEILVLTESRKASLDYAISSIKTDLKYHLMYEGEDIYTKDDMAAILTEIQTEIAGNIESIVGHYDKSTSERNMPSKKR